MTEEKETQIFLAQYREAYEYLRQHSRFMWQVHSLAVVISGGLIVASFAYLKEANLWWVRDLVLLIAGAVTMSLLLAMKKHRYFANSEVHTLSRLEDALDTKRVQRTTRIKKDAPKADNSEPNTEDYWNELKPEDFDCKWRKCFVKTIDCKLEKFFAGRGADKCLGYSMYALLLIIFACIIINTVIGVTFLIKSSGV